MHKFIEEYFELIFSKTPNIGMRSKNAFPWFKISKIEKALFEQISFQLNHHSHKFIFLFQ